MGSYILIVSIYEYMGNSIRTPRVKYFLKHGLRSFTSPELIPYNDSILLSKSGMKNKPNVNAFKLNGKANSYQLDNLRVARWYFFNYIQY